MLSGLIQLHLLTYYGLLTVGTLATAQGVGQVWRAEPLSAGYRSALYALAGTGVVQAAQGGILFLAGYRPANLLHLVYGGIAALGVPIGFAYVSEQMTRRDLAILAFVAFAIVAAALRAYATGGP